MTSVYLCPLQGDGGQTAPQTANAYAPSIGEHPIVIDVPRGVCIVIAADDTITGAGITRLFTAPDPTVASLRQAAATTTVGPGARNQINTWLTNHGYAVQLPAEQVTWLQVINWIARRVDGIADLLSVGTA